MSLKHNIILGYDPLELIRDAELYTLLGASGSPIDLLILPAGTNDESNPLLRGRVFVSQNSQDFFQLIQDGPPLLDRRAPAYIKQYQLFVPNLPSVSLTVSEAASAAKIAVQRCANGPVRAPLVSVSPEAKQARATVVNLYALHGDVHRPIGAAVTKDGQFIVMSVSVDTGFDYYRAFIGTAGTMREVIIQAYRPGNYPHTEILTTNHGELLIRPLYTRNEFDSFLERVEISWLGHQMKNINIDPDTLMEPLGLKLYPVALSEKYTFLCQRDEPSPTASDPVRKPLFVK